MLLPQPSGPLCLPLLGGTRAERRGCLKTSGARPPEQVSFLHRRFLGKQRHRAPPCRLEQRDSPHGGQPTVPSRLGSDVPWCCWAGSDPGGIQAAASCLSSSGPDVKGQPDRPPPRAALPAAGSAERSEAGGAEPTGTSALGAAAHAPTPSAMCVWDNCGSHPGSKLWPCLWQQVGLAFENKSDIEKRLFSCF